MKFELQEILEATGGKLLVNKNYSGSFSISTDSRNILPENIFLPLKGESFDGHNFIGDVIKKGCKAFFLDQNHLDIVKPYFDEANLVIVVENTLESYLKLANFRRHKINPTVIAVTGSCGKTSTKEMLFSVFSQKYKTYRSKLNHNNEVGLCETLLNMPEDTEFLIIEMGMRAQGEIELLSKYAEPDLAVITNVGTSHLGRLGSIENIAKAKCEITKYLNKEGYLVAYDSYLIKKYLNWQEKAIYYSINNSEDIKILAENQAGSKFEYKNFEYELNVPGEHNILNSLAAIEVGLLHGISPCKIRNGLFNYKPIENRWQVIELNNSIKIINDSYNASPDSVKASINTVINGYKNNKIVLVLGNMAELGEYEDSLHEEIGLFLKNKNIYEVITIGDKAQLIVDTLKKNQSIIKSESFNNNDKAIQYLKNNIKLGMVILLKASRYMAFENIAKQLQKNIEEHK